MPSERILSQRWDQADIRLLTGIPDGPRPLVKGDIGGQSCSALRGTGVGLPGSMSTTPFRVPSLRFAFGAWRALVLGWKSQYIFSVLELDLGTRWSVVEIGVGWQCVAAIAVCYPDVQGCVRVGD